MTHERRSDDYEPSESGWAITPGGDIKLHNASIGGVIVDNCHLFGGCPE